MTAGDVEVVRGSLNSRQCVMFDGTDDYILADAHAVARVAADDTVGTYSAWIFLDSIGAGNSTILSVGDNDSATEYFYVGIAAGKLRAWLYHGGANQFLIEETTASIAAKKWTHVAVVQNGTRPILYVNGEAVAMTDTVSTDLTFWYDELTGCDKFAIGVKESNNTHTNDFAGMISDVKYWDLALNAKQILDDYKNATADADVTAHLQLYLPLRTDVLDDGLGADNGTLTGHAYLCGWGSEWARQIELNAVVADKIENLGYDSAGVQTSLILKAA